MRDGSPGEKGCSFVPGEDIVEASMLESEHRQSCEEKLGRPYGEVHQFLDRFYCKYGVWHRMLLHHRLGIELVGVVFGEECRKAAELHIIEDIIKPHERKGLVGGSDAWEDFLRKIPHTWRNYGEPILHVSELHQEMEKDLRELYGEKVYACVARKGIEELVQLLRAGKPERE